MNKLTIELSDNELIQTGMLTDSTGKQSFIILNLKDTAIYKHLFREATNLIKNGK